jgi:hypothetical protein
MYRKKTPLTIIFACILVVAFLTWSFYSIRIFNVSGINGSVSNDKLNALFVLNSVAFELEWNDLMDKQMIADVHSVLSNWKHLFTTREFISLLRQIAVSVPKRFCRGVTGNCVDGSMDISQNLLSFKTMLGTNPFGGNQVYCETGFNFGGSAIVALAAGYTVYSFDVQHYAYSSASVRMLQTLFPGKFHIIIGDSKKTVVQFTSSHPNVKCNFISIDGVHNYEYSKGDFLSFKKFTAASNFVMFDDTGKKYVGGSIRRAWNDLIKENAINEIKCVDYGMVETFKGPRDKGYCYGNAKV